MSNTLAQDGHFAVYLLHFAQPVHGQRHYVGITSFDRLGQRMIEHTTGRGSKLTAAACQQGTAWRLAHFWRTDRRDLEKRLDALKDAPPACPVCRRVSSGVGYAPTKKRPALEAGRSLSLTSQLPLSFPNGAAASSPAGPENTT